MACVNHSYFHLLFIITLLLSCDPDRVANRYYALPKGTLAFVRQYLLVILSWPLYLVAIPLSETWGAAGAEFNISIS